MAKVSAPLFSLGASGTVGDVLTFNQSNTAPVCRRKPTGYKPATIPQAVCRQRCSDAAAHWRSLDAPSRAEWVAVAALSGANVFTKYLLEWNAQGSTPAAPPFLPMR